MTPERERRARALQALDEGLGRVEAIRDAMQAEGDAYSEPLSRACRHLYLAWYDLLLTNPLAEDELPRTDDPDP